MKKSNLLYLKIEDGTQWPLIKPDEDPLSDSIIWRLRHSPNSIEDWEFHEIASIMSAYQSLVTAPYGNKKLPMIRRAIKNL